MAKRTSAKKKGERLIILDSHAILHRAYHAIPDFSTSKGEPTGALYGLTSTLLKSVADLKPDYIVAARDLPGKTNRHELFEEYKGTRVEAEEELVAQLIMAPEVFAAFGIPVYSAPGYEADDVIGTIVKRIEKKKDLSVVIVSGDLDTLQLVKDNVKVYTMRKGITDTVLYDVEKVKERYGFGPEYVTDLKGLRGDPSDNIKGVPGVGEDSALKLIRAFGSVEDIVRAIKKSGIEAVAEKAGVRKRYVELVAGHVEDAKFSKGLATIHASVPIEFEMPKVWTLAENADSIAKMCERFEFRSLRERVLSIAQKGAPIAEKKEEALNIDPRDLKETCIALWLLRSDTTNPTIEDVFSFAGTEDYQKAKGAIFEQLQKTGNLKNVFEKIEKPLLPVVERMNATGILLDAPYLKKLTREYSSGLTEIAGRIFDHAGHEFNINSPKQLATVLYDELKISPTKARKTPTGARTTREEELAKIATLHPIIADVLSYRELQKLLSTYIEKMPALVDKEGRLHTEFLQSGTTTGRMGSQDPNLQNIPVKSESGRRIRTGFIASPGFSLVALDYSQIELRIAAGLSGDKKLVEIFRSGGDVHAAVAAEVFNVAPEKVDREMRRRAKVINFGILYGMGVNALRANLGPDITREEAAQFLSEYFKDFAGLARYIEKTKADAARLGYTETLFGRRRYFPGFRSALPNLRAQAERMAINAPIQGTQSDIIKLAMVEADNWIEKEGLREKVRLLLQVHDELVYEIEKSVDERAASELKHIMESVVDTKKLSGVPIVTEVNVGPNWGTLQKMNVRV